MKSFERDLLTAIVKEAKAIKTSLPDTPLEGENLERVKQAYFILAETKAKMTIPQE